MKIMNARALVVENMTFNEKNRDFLLTYGQNNNNNNDDKNLSVSLYILYSSQKTVSLKGSHKDFWSVLTGSTGS